LRGNAATTKDKAMERIIAGRFRNKQSADAVAAILTQYVNPNDICVFKSPKPVPAEQPARPQEKVVPHDTTEVSKSTVGTALAAGAAAGVIGALGGPVIALVAASTGAYLGSLVGTLGAMGEHPQDAVTFAPRQEGVILGVHIIDPQLEAHVVETLRSEGAADVEQAMGEWRDGKWQDFDPASAPQLVETPLAKKAPDKSSLN